MRKTPLTLLLVMLLGVTLLVPAATQAQSSVRVVLAYYSAQTEPVFQEIKEAFEAENPDIKVHLEVVAWDNLFQHLTTRIAGGQEPDLAIIGTRWLPGFVEQGVAQPLDEFIDDAFRSQFAPALFEPSTIDGKIYGLPVAASARALFYNKDLFAAAGVTNPPDTWEELVEIGRKLHNPPHSYAFGLQGKEIETDVYWYYAMWSFGGDILTPDGLSGINSPEAVESLQFYYDLIHKEKITQPEPLNYNREELQDLFKQGRLAMMISAPFLVGQVRTEAPHIDFGVAPIPRHRQRVTYGVTDTIMMFRNASDKQAAWKFLEFAFRDENRFKFNTAEGFLPVKATPGANPFLDDPIYGVFASLLPDAKFAPLIADWERVADETIRAVQQVYLGSADPQSALDAAVRRINRFLR